MNLHTFLFLLDVFEPQCPRLRCPLHFGGLFGLLAAVSRIHLPMSIRRISQKVILIRKSDRLPPIFMERPSRCSHRGCASFRSARALPNEHRFANVVPEGARNLGNNAFRVFRVFGLGG